MSKDIKGYPELDAPSPHELADADDTLDWDRDKHGQMVDFAVPDDELVETVPYESESEDD